MFNNLGNVSKNGAVDDIFAETDSANHSASNVDIETRHVGLASSGGGNPLTSGVASSQLNHSASDQMSQAMISEEDVPQDQGGKKNYLRIILIVIIVLALGGAAYFAYWQFFSPKNSLIEPVVTIDGLSGAAVVNDFVDIVPEEIANVIEENNGNLVEGSLDLASTSTSSESVNGVSSGNNFGIDGSPDVDFYPVVDSDGDGLSDQEESVLGTNPNLIDSDNDGLSDYEEVTIYFTDPLNPDTDGDGYLDGAEVKAGYDPNVVGAKLPGNIVE